MTSLENAGTQIEVAACEYHRDEQMAPEGTPIILRLLNIGRNVIRSTALSIVPDFSNVYHLSVCISSISPMSFLIALVRVNPNRYDFALARKWFRHCFGTVISASATTSVRRRQCHRGRFSHGFNRSFRSQITNPVEERYRERATTILITSDKLCKSIRGSSHSTRACSRQAKHQTMWCWLRRAAPG
jgi:hypothetical protein